VFNVSSRVMQSGSRGEECVTKILDIVSEVGRQGDYINGLEWLCSSGIIILAVIQLRNSLLSII